jgi:hypothetical protein
VHTAHGHGDGTRAVRVQWHDRSGGTRAAPGEGTPDALLGARFAARGWGGSPGAGTPDARIGARFSARGGAEAGGGTPAAGSVYRFVDRGWCGSPGEGTPDALLGAQHLGSWVGRIAGLRACCRLIIGCGSRSRPVRENRRHGRGCRRRTTTVSRPAGRRRERDERWHTTRVETRAQVAPAPAGSAARGVRSAEPIVGAGLRDAGGLTRACSWRWHAGDAGAAA